MNRVPSTTQIADAMGISSCKYQQLDREAQAGSPVSLEGAIAEICSKAIASSDPEESSERPNSDNGYQAIQSLPSIGQRVLNAILHGDSVHQIACELSLCDSRVAQVKSSAIAELRRILSANSVQCSQRSRLAT